MTCENENATATYGSLHDAFSASQRRSADQPGSQAAMPVAERFVSINGEGACAGKLAAFIRFTGCNLRCGYCDTMWANVPGAAAKDETPEQLAAWVRQTGVECVTLTGGEPVLQPLLPRLVELLLGEPGPSGRGLRVEIETNGAADLGELAALRARIGSAAPGTLAFTVDWKLPSSGMEQRMLPANFRLLDGRDTVKFVCGQGDLPRVLEVARQLDLPGRVPVYLSPCFGGIEPARIVEFMQENQMTWATAQVQLHKVIWPDVERGV
ncbi:radical SAM protein [Senegalimassilia anaerobia]|uniref:radical SAM protein n=1 Tax=Senegalimassilia anaerobia TaxID=1473216 RepID=UPI0026F1E570|nr:radical SAM protein [Senegalimassilia anaerobia]